LSLGAERPGTEVRPPSGLKVGHAPGRGRGVFAERAIAAGEVVECVPVIVFPPEEQHHLVETVLNSYVFGWRDSVAIALGFGSIYNHSWRPNLEYRKRFEEGLIEFLALADLPAGTELTINYASSNPHNAGLWSDLEG
jgi:hypothetical protein